MSLLMDALRRADCARNEMAEAAPSVAPAGDATALGMEARPGLSLAPLDEEEVDRPLAVAAPAVSVSPPMPLAPVPEAARPATEMEHMAPETRRQPEPEGGTSETRARSAAIATPIARELHAPERRSQTYPTGTPRLPAPGSPESAASRTTANAVFLSKRAVPPARANTTRVMVLVGVVLLLLVAGAGGYLYLMDDGGGLVPQGQVVYQPRPVDEPVAVGTATEPEASLAEPPSAAATEPTRETLPVTSALRLTPESAVPLIEELPARAAPHDTMAPARISTPAPVEPPAAPVAVANEPLRVTRSVSVSKAGGLVRAAWEAYMRGNLTLAREGYQEALTLDRLNRDGLLGLAAVEATEGNLTAALGYYGRMLERDPRDPAALDGVFALGGDATALDEQALRGFGAGATKSSAASFAQGNLFAAQERWSDAQEAYFNAYSRARDNADYAFNLAISLEHLGQRQPAMDYYRLAVELTRRRPHGFDPAQAQSRIEALLAQGGG